VQSGLRSFAQMTIFGRKQAIRFSSQARKIGRSFTSELNNGKAPTAVIQCRSRSMAGALAGKAGMPC
jgi:hypothetical protein